MRTTGHDLVRVGRKEERGGEGRTKEEGQENKLEDLE
jgi:hypothetical protein